MNNPKVSSDGPPQSDPTEPSATLPLKDVQILIVDDEADTRDLLGFVLAEAGAIVTAVASAAAALETLTQSAFDVLISDIGMPGTDGYTLIREVRILPSDRVRDIPAIALTAYAGDIDQQRAIAAGFDKHISKPVDPGELVDLVREYAQPASGQA